jgi:hypothetical protein
VLSSIVDPRSRIFLIIEYEDGEYMGCLHFSDPIFCRQILTVLQARRGKTIQEIGDLDVSNLL